MSALDKEILNHDSELIQFANAHRDGSAGLGSSSGAAEVDISVSPSGLFILI